MEPYPKQAEDYKNYNKYSQFIYGKNFINSLDINPSYNVLAVGCGTGNLAAYVAQSKVPEGSVLAFDPDKLRIKQANEEFHGVENLSFEVGRASEFPKGKEDEYDLIYSNAVLHWIPKEERLETFKCFHKALKSGQTMAHLFVVTIPKVFFCMTGVLSPEENKRLIKFEENMMSRKEVESLAENSGFKVVSIEEYKDDTKFANVEQCLDWINGTAQGLLVDIKEKYYKNKEKVNLNVEKDGSVIKQSHLMKIVFRK